MHGVAFVLRKRSSSRRNGGSFSFLCSLRATNRYTTRYKHIYKSIHRTTNNAPGDLDVVRCRCSPRSDERFRRVSPARAAARSASSSSWPAAAAVLLTPFVSSLLLPPPPLLRPPISKSSRLPKSHSRTGRLVSVFSCLGYNVQRNNRLDQCGLIEKNASITRI